MVLSEKSAPEHAESWHVSGRLLGGEWLEYLLRKVTSEQTILSTTHLAPGRHVKTYQFLDVRLGTG